MMRIGLFGGTFDPIHLGHLDVADAARRRLALDEVWLMPARVPPHRQRAARVGRAPVRDGGARRAGRRGLSGLRPRDGRRTGRRTPRRRSTGWLARGCRSTGRVLHHRRRRLPRHRDLEGLSPAARSLPLRGRLAAGRAAPAAAGALPASPTGWSIAPGAIAAPGPRIVLVDAPTAPVSSTDVRRPGPGGEAIDGLVPRRGRGVYRDARSLRGHGDVGERVKEPHEETATRAREAPTTPATLRGAHRWHRRRARQESLRRRRARPAKASAFTDFFVICTGTTSGRCRPSPTACRRRSQEAARSRRSSKATSRGEWVLIDYFDLIFHVFTPATREFYGLERLWGDAERIEVSADDARASDRRFCNVDASTSLRDRRRTARGRQPCTANDGA